MEEPKRQISILLPYRQSGDTVSVYLQKRSADAKVLPGHFGFWGGGAEGDESPSQTLTREVQEELGISIDAEKLMLLNRYEFLRSIKYVYLFLCPAGWEDTTTVGEGDFGKWFTLDEALSEPLFIHEDKTVISDVGRVLLKLPIR